MTTAPSRTTQENAQQIDIESIIADIQRGIYQASPFFGSIQSASTVGNFFKGVNTSLSYSGASTLKHDLVDEREPGRDFRITRDEYAVLQKRAQSIAGYGNIPEDVAEDFLLILCYINNLNDMITIADAIQLPELADINILRRPMIILNLQNLERACYAASALDGLINMFRKYIQASQYVDDTPGESILDMLSGFNLGSMAMQMIQSGSPTELASSIMTELLTGKRVPTNVIAKNPNMQSPSYVGKAFFGESPIPLSNVDIDQVFNKVIAVFPQASAGAGTTAFGFQNSKSFSNIMSMTQLVSKINFGSINIIPGSFKEIQVNSIVGKINDMIGTTAESLVDLRRADNALPFMSSLSAINSGVEKSLFTIDTFRNAWNNSNAISNHLQITNPTYMETVKRFL